jgi:hypothetical protein
VVAAADRRKSPNKRPAVLRWMWVMVWGLVGLFIGWVITMWVLHFSWPQYFGRR